jgi:hypothetical protein
VRVCTDAGWPVALPVMALLISLIAIKRPKGAQLDDAKKEKGLGGTETDIEMMGSVGV